MRILIGLALLLAGCASGEIYWTRAGATPERFLDDHGPCFTEAKIGYGLGNEELYKRCMRAKGWERVQGRGTQPPSVPYFRGPEDDEDFGPLTDLPLTEQCRRWRDGLDRHRRPPDCSAVSRE